MHGFIVLLAGTLDFLLDAFQVLVVAQWILSLVDADPGNPLVRAVDALCGPPLGWLRRRLPFLAMGGWDFSPVAAFLVCGFLKDWAVGRVLLGAA